MHLQHIQPTTYLFTCLYLLQSLITLYIDCCLLDSYSTLSTLSSSIFFKAFFSFLKGCKNGEVEKKACNAASVGCVTFPKLAHSCDVFPVNCSFWRNHPTFVWGLIGWLGTVGGPVNVGTIGGTFGVPTVPGFSPNMNVLQALSNTRTDGYGELYREGTAAFLNSMAHARFPYSTTQVRDSFIAALSSNKAAAAQAQLFKLANEGRTKPRVIVGDVEEVIDLTLQLHVNNT